MNNIVRAFEVHGPLDKELLRQALNRVASLHPFLSALFQRHKGQLYALLPRPGKCIYILGPHFQESYDVFKTAWAVITSTGTSMWLP